MAATKARKPSLIELTLYFLKIGLLGFGGPLAIMAAFQDDLVKKKKWLSQEKFSRVFALIKIMPGPLAPQLAAYLGMQRAGRIGGLLAVIGMALPAFIMMIVLATFYKNVEEITWMKRALFGMQATSLGVIAYSVWRLASPYKKKALFWVIAACACLLNYRYPAYEPLIILGAGLLGLISVRVVISLVPAILLFTKNTFAAGITPNSVSFFSTLPESIKVGLVCLKTGAIVFGSGLAIVPMLAHDVVTKYHWMNTQQFMDALAFGQVTPGPIVITATFIGFQVAGFMGALLATIGIFGPGTFNILTWFSYLEKKFGKSKKAAVFAMWAIGAVVGCIIEILHRLGNTPIENITVHVGSPNAILWAICFGSLGLSIFTKIPVWILIPSGSILGLVTTMR